MNWLIKLKRPALFVLSVITFFSCDDSNTLGTSYEGNPVDASFTDSVSVTASTVLANDSIVGYRNGNLLVGKFTTEKLGTTTAQSYLPIGPTGGSISANNGSPDSVVLMLDYDEYYGDTTQNYSIEVRELGTTFRSDATYYTNNNNSLEALPSLIGSLTFVPKPKRTNSKTSSSGVVTKTSVPVRMKLSNELGQRILGLPSTTLSSTAEFAKIFKGIVLSPGPNTKSALGFAPDADSTYLRIYYTSTDNKKQKYDLNISGGNDRLNEISHDFAGSALTSLNKAGDSISSVAAGNEAYLQESTGIVTKITFPYLNRFREKLNTNDVAVNRAELIIPVKDNPNYLPSPAAYLVETNKTNRILKSNRLPRVVIEDPLETTSRGESGTQAAAIRYNKDKKAYIVNVTKYVQDVIYQRQSASGKLLSNSLLLVPTSRTGSLDPRGSTVLEATGLYSSILQTGGTNNIKLRLYFSKTN
ncbi:DUF4270 family protein [Adhaeribacter pallidiroseus]|uniref:DUF4270 domain-containing protein n=1 Tax=Adhaeribacter pallidiroseus TaxID=2072847 RepID=A0A369QQB8_9BACT|nr:DUF4270 family protein [Adhaeribacter pallidiroseus]RDC65875.1 hypothetical protein AHMF7616_04506 [Adhaeribacter pallidiroseus]